MSSSDSLPASQESGGDPKCPNCNIDVPVAGLGYCVKCTKIVLKLHQKNQAERIERNNQNDDKLVDLNRAMQKVLTSTEQATFLEFIPEESRRDAKEIIDILRGYTQSKHQKNKSRKEDEAVSKITHLLYGYKTPAIVITAQRVFVPQSLRTKMEDRANQMEAIHPNRVNYLSNGTRMLQDILKNVSDVKRTSNNQEAFLCEKVEKEFWKSQRRKNKKKDDDIGSSSDLETAIDSVDSEEDEEEMDSQHSKVVGFIPLSHDERSESVVDSLPHTGSGLKLPSPKKLRVHYPKQRNKSKESLSIPQNNPAWNAELNVIASTPKLTKTVNENSGYNDATGSFEMGMRQMPPPYPGYDASPGIATQAEGHSGFMSPILGQQRSSIVKPKSPVSLVTEINVPVVIANQPYPSISSQSEMDALRPQITQREAAPVCESGVAVTCPGLSAIPIQSTFKPGRAHPLEVTTSISTQKGHASSHYTSTPLIPQLSLPPSNTMPDQSSLPNTQVSVQYTSLPRSKVTPINTMSIASAVNVNQNESVIRGVQNHPQLISSVALGAVSLGSPVKSVGNTTICQTGLQPRGMSLPKSKENSSIQSRSGSYEMVKRKGMFQRFTDEDIHSEDESEPASTFRFSYQVQKGVIGDPPGGGSSETYLNDSYSAPVENYGMEVEEPEDQAMDSFKHVLSTEASPAVTPEPKTNPTVPPPPQPHRGGPQDDEDESIISKMARVSYSLQVFVGNLPHNCTKKDLRELFSTFGKIMDIGINQTTGCENQSISGREDVTVPNFGFVIFNNRDAVEKALQARPIFLFGRHPLHVEEKEMKTPGDIMGWEQGAVYHQGPPMSGLGERASQVEQEKCQWLEQLGNFMKSRNTPLKQPTIAKKELDLFKFYKITKAEGGFVECVKNKAWKKIADQLEIGHSTSLTFMLRKHYENCILPYECHFDRGGADPTSILAEMKPMKKKPEGTDRIQFPDKSEVKSSEERWSTCPSEEAENVHTNSSTTQNQPESTRQNDESVESQQSSQNKMKSGRLPQMSTTTGRGLCLGSPLGMARPQQNVSPSTPLLASGHQLAAAHIVKSNGEDPSSIKLSQHNKQAKSGRIGEKIDSPTVIGTQSQRPRRSRGRSLLERNPEFVVNAPSSYGLVKKIKDSVSNVSIKLSKTTEVEAVSGTNLEFPSMPNLPKLSKTRSPRKSEKVIGGTVEDCSLKMNFVEDSFVNDTILNLSQDSATPSLK